MEVNKKIPKSFYVVVLKDPAIRAYNYCKDKYRLYSLNRQLPDYLNKLSDIHDKDIKDDMGIILLNNYNKSNDIDNIIIKYNNPKYLYMKNVREILTYVIQKKELAKKIESY